jgi:hypothetical protein
MLNVVFKRLSKCLSLKRLISPDDQAMPATVCARDFGLKSEVPDHPFPQNIARYGSGRFSHGLWKKLLEMGFTGT